MLAVLFLLPNSSKKLSAQKCSSFQVLKAFFYGYDIRCLPPTWKYFTNITVKYELSSYVTDTVVSYCKTIYKIVFFLKNTRLLFQLFDIKSHKQSRTKQAIKLLASTIPLICKTLSLSILKKYPVSYICPFTLFTLIMNKACFIANFFLLNNCFYKITTI